MTALLEFGASVRAATRQGVTPLHLGAQEGHLDVVTLLLARDAPTNACTKVRGFGSLGDLEVVEGFGGAAGVWRA